MLTDKNPVFQEGLFKKARENIKRRCVTRKSSPHSPVRDDPGSENSRALHRNSIRSSPKLSQNRSLSQERRQLWGANQRRLTERRSADTLKDSLVKHIRDQVRKTGIPPPTTVDFYRIAKEIGKGAFGKVYSGVHLLTSLPVAIKSVNKASDREASQKVMYEAFLMQRIKHRNVVRLLEVFESSNHIYIVLEHVSGGTLLSMLKQKGKFEEEEAQQLFSQLIDGVSACHKAKVAHRDIKLDNVLVTDTMQIKLCDFGVSRIAEPGVKVSDQCGTPAYLAPEIVAKKVYDPLLVDIWSLGVLLYVMLTGGIPFKAKTIKDLHKLILKGEYAFPDYISLPARDLIQRMLHLIPSKRIPIAGIKNHPWLTEFSCLVERKNYVSGGVIMEKLNSYGFPYTYVKRSLMLGDVNHGTGTYRLLEISQMSKQFNLH